MHVHQRVILKHIRLMELYIPEYKHVRCYRSLNTRKADIKIYCRFILTGRKKQTESLVMLTLTTFICDFQACSVYQTILQLHPRNQQWVGKGSCPRTEEGIAS